MFYTGWPPNHPELGPLRLSCHTTILCLTLGLFIPLIHAVIINDSQPSQEELDSFFLSALLRMPTRAIKKKKRENECCDD